LLFPQTKSLKVAALQMAAAGARVFSPTVKMLLLLYMCIEPGNWGSSWWCRFSDDDFFAPTALMMQVSFRRASPRTHRCDTP
jgi:hypothetical protein